MPSARNMREYMELNRDVHSSFDLLDAQGVELEVDQTGKCWVNIDGVCVARVRHADAMRIGSYSQIIARNRDDCAYPRLTD